MSGVTDELRAAAIEAAKADPEIAAMAQRGAGVFHALPSIVDVALRLADHTVVANPPAPDEALRRALRSLEGWCMGHAANLPGPTGQHDARPTPATDAVWDVIDEIRRRIGTLAREVSGG